MFELFAEVPMTRASLAYVAKGLRECAMVDGIHAREVELVEMFEAAAGLESEVDSTLDAGGPPPFVTDTERELYLRSLLLLCLADGAVSDGEGAYVAEEADRVGVSSVRLFQLDREARMYMLSGFRGVRAFRDQAEKVGADLGLTPEEIAATLD